MKKKKGLDAPNLIEIQHSDKEATESLEGMYDGAEPPQGWKREGPCLPDILYFVTVGRWISK